MSLLIEWLFWPFSEIPFRALFRLPDGIPTVQESIDPSRQIERDKWLELYYSRGYL
jgi:hypothetical protein